MQLIAMKRHVNRMVYFTFVLIFSLLQGCSSTSSPQAKAEPVASMSANAVQPSANGYFLPKDIFKGSPASISGDTVNNVSPYKVVGQPVALSPMVWLYTSPTSKAYYESSSIDFKVNARLWEIFFKKYKIPYKVVTSPDRLESSPPGVLVLPSLAALSEREKQAIVKFRAQGGSVLSSWLSGVRDDKGAWQGFSFMRDALGVQVLGDTEGEEEENFLMTYGDGPVTHSLPAGQRVWLERVKGIYPLRLAGQQAAGQIMDWSRMAVRGKPGANIVFGEQRQTSGVLSRSVVLGYSERLWMSADPKAMEAIAHNALTWLLRQPDSYLSAWPFPYTGALSVAIDSPDVVDDVDIKFAEWIEKTGGRATYYVLSSNAAKSAESLKNLQSKGHEIGFMADRFEGFQDQLTTTQSKRLTSMQQELRDAGLTTSPDRGFHAPMESQDKSTLDLINQLGFTHAVAFMDISDGRLPVIVPRLTSPGGTQQKPMVILPRTLSGPEDLMGEGDPDDGMKQYMAEFEMSSAMGGLSLIRFPNQTLLTDDQLKAIFDQINRNSNRLWNAPNGAVARWWLDRDRISIDIDVVDGKTRLSATISPGESLSQPAAVIVNSPYANDDLKLISLGQDSPVVKVSKIDPWRSAVSLGGLRPGTYRWALQFDRASLTNAK